MEPSLSTNIVYNNDDATTPSYLHGDSGVEGDNDAITDPSAEISNEKRDFYILLPEDICMKINGSYISIDMFSLKNCTILNDKLSDSCKIEDVLDKIRPLDSDIDLGYLYAVIGTYYINDNVGYLIVLSSDIAVKLFNSTLICQCVQFANKIVNEKLRRRISRNLSMTSTAHKVSIDSSTNVLLTIFSNGLPFIINTMQKRGRLLDNQLKLIWGQMFENNSASLLTSDRVDLNIIKKRVLIKVQHPKNSTTRDRNSKLMTVENLLERGYLITECNQGLKQSHLTDKLNLREETISLGKCMFDIKWSPDKFTQAFSKFKESCGPTIVSAVAASVLMDPSFRIDDSEDFDTSNVVERVSVDLDQLIIKFNLYIESNNLSEDQLLSNWYAILAPLLISTKNATTLFSPTLMRRNIHRRGVSGDSTVERNKYVSLLTNSITTEVLNISYKRTLSETADVEQCIDASLTVINFLLSSEKSVFQNVYSLEMIRAARINWSHTGAQSQELFQVSGGLLFHFLTLFLVSSRGQNPIRVSIETYGGKKRGEKVSWKYSKKDVEPLTTMIKETYENFCSSEADKIAFLLRRVIREIKICFPNSVQNISSSLGLGCDARGSVLSNGHPSFLVCQPTAINEIEVCRKGETRTAFSREDKSVGPDLSNQTRSLARSCDTFVDDSDHSSEEKSNIRTR